MTRATPDAPVKAASGPQKEASTRPALWGSGDIAAFLGLCFDNVAQLIVFSTLLIQVFRFPADLVLRRMLPGTALGVLIGDLLYTWLAVRLSRRSGRPVTAMPLGIDTVSLFGLTFGVLGPVFLQTKDAQLAFHTGMALMVMMGLFKIGVSFFAARIARLVPPAALLGTIGGVGLLLIAFMPMGKLFAAPQLGLPLLFVTLLCLLRGLRLGKVPMVLLIVIGGALAQRALVSLGQLPPPHGADVALVFGLPLPTLAWLDGLSMALRYLPIGLPLAFVTVVGGIDNTASAAAAGDEYPVRDILLVEGVSTLLAAVCGGVIQTTPYIGHPAYKRMGGRAGYTLATALFVGLGGIFGYLAVLVHALPEIAVVPILVFIGLEISAQAFRGVPEGQAPAVAASFLPVIAYVIVVLADQWLGPAAAGLSGEAGATYRALKLLSSGFVFASLLFGAAVAYMIEGRGGAAALALLLGAVGSLFGLLHSPLPGGALFWPWRLPGPEPLRSVAGYVCAALLVLGLSQLEKNFSPARKNG